MRRFQVILKKIFEITKKQEMRILPGQLAFFLFLSLVPLLTLIGFIFTRFSLSLDSVLEFINASFPSGTSALIIPMFNQSNIDGNVIIFMATGFFLASNGPHSIVVSSNMLYGIENGNYFKNRLKAIIMTIILVVLILFIVVVLAFGSIIFKNLIDFNIFSQITNELYDFVTLIKWPVAALLTFTSIKTIYAIAPNSRIPSRYMTKGALFTTTGIMFVTWIYSYYVSNIANYGVFYGGLSSIVILMIWAYLVSYLIVLGIAINASSYTFNNSQAKKNIMGEVSDELTDEVNTDIDIDVPIVEEATV